MGKKVEGHAYRNWQRMVRVEWSQTMNLNHEEDLGVAGVSTKKSGASP